MKRLIKLFLMLKYQRQIRAALSTQLELLSGGHGADALGGLTAEETKALCTLAHCVPAGAVIMEFGTLFGLTTQALAEAAPEGVTIVTVDNFCWNPFGIPPEMHRDFTHRILKPYLTSGRVRIIDQDSATFRNNYSGDIPALVFFDADHSYASVRDEIAWAKEKKISVVSGHDYNNRAFGVTRAVDEAFPNGVQTAGMVWWHA